MPARSLCRQVLCYTLVEYKHPLIRTVAEVNKQERGVETAKTEVNNQD